MNPSVLDLGPALLNGAVVPPPSKSLLHRGMICTALAGQAPDTLLPEHASRDILATVEVLETLVSGNPGERVTVNCGESGTTLRLLVPVAACLRAETVFLGEGRLPQRPMQPYADAFAGHGVTLRFPEEPGCYLPLTLSGRPQPGVYTLPGDVSSQFISGLLLALPLLEAPSEIRLASPLESESYVRMTLSVMRAHGIEVEPLGDGGWRIPAPQTYRPPVTPFRAEPDASQAAFWQLANHLGSFVRLAGGEPTNLQGDAVFPELLARLRDEHPGDTLDIDVSQTPDLVPALAAAAAYARGTTRLTHAARLRLKESDRLASTCAMLRAFGSACEETPDSLIIPPGPPTLPAGLRPIVDGANDHRIVMTAAMLATRAPCTIVGAEAVRKSYPSFFEEYRRVGGIATHATGS